MMTLLLSWGGIQQSPSRQSRQFQERTTHQITSHLYSGVLPKMRCPHQVLSMGAMRLAPSPPLLVPSLLLPVPSSLPAPITAARVPSPLLLAPSHFLLVPSRFLLVPSHFLLVPSRFLLAPSCLLLAPSPSLLAPSPLPLSLPMADTMSPMAAMSNLARTSPISPSIMRTGGWTMAAAAMMTMTSICMVLSWTSTAPPGVNPDTNANTLHPLLCLLSLPLLDLNLCFPRSRRQPCAIVALPSVHLALQDTQAAGHSDPFQVPGLRICDLHPRQRHQS